jgi:hypothetical protein
MARARVLCWLLVVAALLAEGEPKKTSLAPSARCLGVCFRLERLLRDFGGISQKGPMNAFKPVTLRGQTGLNGQMMSNECNARSGTQGRLHFTIVAPPPPAAATAATASGGGGGGAAAAAAAARGKWCRLRRAGASSLRHVTPLLLRRGHAP